MRRILGSVAIALGLNIWSNPAVPDAARVVAEPNRIDLANPESDGAGQPPFDPDELWTKVLTLLNEHNGSVTKEQFERVLGVRLGDPRSESDATTYLIHAGTDGHFDARLTIYNDRFRWPGPENGAHSQWYINWSMNPSGDAPMRACLTAERVRSGLVATGWTPPWRKWGLWEEDRQKTAKELQEHAPPGGYMYPPQMPTPIAAFRRKTDEDRGDRDHLPRGRLDATGDFPDSCVTGIHVTAKP